MTQRSRRGCQPGAGRQFLQDWQFNTPALAGPSLITWKKGRMGSAKALSLPQLLGCQTASPSPPLSFASPVALAASAHPIWRAATARPAAPAASTPPWSTSSQEHQLKTSRAQQSAAGAIHQCREESLQLWSWQWLRPKAE